MGEHNPQTNSVLPPLNRHISLQTQPKTSTKMASTLPNLSPIFALHFTSHPNRSLSFQFSPPLSGHRLLLRSAAKPPPGPLSKKRKKRTSKPKPKPEPTSNPRRRSRDIDSVDDDDEVGDDDGVDDEFLSMPLPKPPAGFVFDDEGRVLLASKKRIVPVFDPERNQPLDCVVRRVFKSSKGDDCLLVCPVDLPISLLKSTNFEGWILIGDEEIEAVLPAVDYTLAKTHMHLVHSGFFYTARGGLAYKEENAFNYIIEEGVESEALQIVCFHLDGAHYMIYTPVDPITFVVIKDDKGVYRCVDAELSDDPDVINATNEEIEFSAIRMRRRLRWLNCLTAECENARKPKAVSEVADSNPHKKFSLLKDTKSQ